MTAPVVHLKDENKESNSWKAHGPSKMKVGEH